MLHLPIALCVVSRGPTLLDTKGRAQLFDQGGREVCPPVTQQLSGCSEDCYKALVEHLRNHLGHLVFGHHSKGIPHEMVSHHKDIFHHEGLVQLHCGLDTGVVRCTSSSGVYAQIRQRGALGTSPSNAWQHGHPLTIARQSSAIMGHQNLSCIRAKVHCCPWWPVSRCTPLSTMWH